MNAPRERRIALPYLTLAALEWGDPAAPPLVALHGWLDNAASFAALAPLLAPRHRTIALELPGHGHSGHLPAGAGYRQVFRIVSTVTFASYALGLVELSIWFSRSWGTTLRGVVDGLVYALLTAGTFGWLWPH